MNSILMLENKIMVKFGVVLFQNNYRTKTDKVKLIKEVL